MKALCVQALCGLDAVQLVERPVPEIHPSLVTVCLRMVGLCRTDLLVAQGKLPIPGESLVLGHEGSGVVVNDPTGRFQSGQRVGFNPYLPEGKFLGLHVDGILQEYVQISADHLVAADDVPFEISAYVEPVAASMAVLKALRQAQNQRGLILGDNRIAHLTYLILDSLGYKVDWVKAVRYQGPADTYDYAIETYFEKEAIQSLVVALKPEGLLVVKSRQFMPTEVVAAQFVQKELTLKAVNYADFNEAMAWVKNHQKVIEPLMGDIYPLADWKKAFEAASVPTASKIFIRL